MTVWHDDPCSPGSDELDMWTVDRLLDGSLPASEIPVGYEQVATLVAAIRAGVAPAESGWGSQTVPAMAQAVIAAARRPPRRGRRAATSARRLPHVAAALGIFVTLGASSAAAATGRLPTPVEHAVQTAAVRLGIVTARTPSPPAGSGAGATSSHAGVPPAEVEGTAAHPTDPVVDQSPSAGPLTARTAGGQGGAITDDRTGVGASNAPGGPGGTTATADAPAEVTAGASKPVPTAATGDPTGARGDTPGSAAASPAAQSGDSQGGPASGGDAQQPERSGTPAPPAPVPAPTEYRPGASDARTSATSVPAPTQGWNSQG